MNHQRSAEFAARSRPLRRSWPPSTTKSRRSALFPHARRCRGPRSSRRAASPDRCGGSRRCRRSRVRGGRATRQGSRRGTCGPELTVWPRPHVPTRFCRDDELVAVRLEIAPHHPAKVLFGRAVRRPVVVGQIEMGDPPVEGVAEAPHVATQTADCRRSCTRGRMRSRAVEALTSQHAGTAWCRSARATLSTDRG